MFDVMQKSYIALKMAPWLLIFLALSLILPERSIAGPAEEVKIEPPRTVFEGLSIFSKSFDTNKVLEIVDVSDEPEARAKSAKDDDTATAKQVDSNSNPEWYDKANLRFISSNPNDDPILGPDQTPSVRVNPNAPSSFKGIVAANRLGDKPLADSYADQFIRYQQNMFFEVRDIVSLIGDALIRQRVIDEDDWVGFSQMMDYELAHARQETGAVIKPTHDVAMKRITADSKQQAEIYFFFTLNCSWCRYMAPDVERLWRLVEDDPRIKMTALTVGPAQEEYLEEYRTYTDWTLPVYDGSELAKQWNIGFVPALVIVAPNGDKAYMKTGQQTFDRMYEFVRTVQGLPATVTKEFQQLVSAPIGQAERLQKNQQVVLGRGGSKNYSVVPPALAISNKEKKVEIQRF